MLNHEATVREWSFAFPFALSSPPGGPRGHGAPGAHKEQSGRALVTRAVLLVEDDAQLAEMYRMRLERENIDVTVAVDGDEALKLASTLAYDLVLMDIGLPKLGGLEVIRTLRSEPATAGIPMVVLSNYSEPAMVKEGLDLGVLAYLVKADTTPARLVDSVLRWLGQKSS